MMSEQKPYERDARSCGVGDDRCRDDLMRRDFLAFGSGLTAACATTMLLAGVRWSEAAGVISGGAGQERTYAIPDADGAIIDRASQVILVRQQQAVYAFNLSCPHQNAAVRWVPSEPRFQCSRHDSRYRPDGTHTAGRATRNMDRFPIRLDGTTLVVDVSRVIHSDQDPAGWAAASVRLG
jgi:nitrite reductase/ring-hydroxylating ferredoxin subunit